MHPSQVVFCFCSIGRVRRYLGGNRLTALDEDTFSNMTSLQVLYVRMRGISVCVALSVFALLNSTYTLSRELGQ